MLLCPVPALIQPPSTAGDVPYAALLFSTFALYEEAICGCLGQPADVFTRAAAGCLCGATATCLTYPLDVLRARFAAEVADALSTCGFSWRNPCPSCMLPTQSLRSLPPWVPLYALSSVYRDQTAHTLYTARVRVITSLYLSTRSDRAPLKCTKVHHPFQRFHKHEIPIIS